MTTSIRVLYVDDYPLDRELVCDALDQEQGAFVVTLAASRAEFEQALAGGGFDLVLSDFNILGFEGLQVLDKVQASPAPVPVVIVTGTGSEEVAVEAMKRGAADYVIKTPRHIQRLPITIRAVLERRQLEAEQQRAQEQIARQVQQLSALRAIETAIGSSFELDVVLDVLLRHVVDALQVDAAAIALLDPQDLTLEYVSTRGFRREVAARLRVPMSESHAWRAILERRRVEVPDLRQPFGFQRGSSLLAGEDFVCSYSVPLIAKEQVKGVLDLFQRATLSPDQAWFNFLDMLAQQAAIAINDALVVANLRRSNSELLQAYDTTIEGWARALDLRDRETHGHTQRVTELTMALAREFGLSDEALGYVRWGALLHDIGKLGVPDAILLKPGPLTSEEWEVMRMHPSFAYEMLLPITYLKSAIDIPYCHHEKWDGSGYPRGLRGDAIPLPARIFAVVDVWDALSSDRPYRAAWDYERIVAHLRAEAGHAFDPQVVEVFLTMLGPRGAAS